MFWVIWLNVLLLTLLLLFPIFLEINKKYLKGKNKNYNKMLKYARKAHPYIGITVIAIGAFHGYIMLGGKLILHTGSILLLMLVINGAVGFYYKKSRNKAGRKAHIIIGLLIVLAFALHYLNPWLLS